MMKTLVVLAVLVLACQAIVLPPALHPDGVNGACHNCKPAYYDRTPNSVLSVGFVDYIEGFGFDGLVQFGNIDTNVAVINTAYVNRGVVAGSSSNTGHAVETPGNVIFNGGNLDLNVVGDVSLVTTGENLQFQGQSGSITATTTFSILSKDVDVHSGGNINLSANKTLGFSGQNVYIRGVNDITASAADASISAAGQWNLQGSYAQFSGGSLNIQSVQENVFAKSGNNFNLQGSGISITGTGLVQIGSEHDSTTITAGATATSNVSGGNIDFDGLDGATVTASAGISINAFTNIVADADEVTYTATKIVSVVSTNDLELTTLGIFDTESQSDITISGQSINIADNDQFLVDGPDRATFFFTNNIEVQDGNWVDFESTGPSNFFAQSNVYFNTLNGNIYGETTGPGASINFVGTTNSVFRFAANDDVTIDTQANTNLNAAKEVITSGGILNVKAKSNINLQSTGVVTLTTTNGKDFMNGVDDIIISGPTNWFTAAAELWLDARESFISRSSLDTSFITTNNMDITASELVNFKATQTISHSATTTVRIDSGDDLTFNGASQIQMTAAQQTFSATTVGSQMSFFGLGDFTAGAQDITISSFGNTLFKTDGKTGHNLLLSSVNNAGTAVANTKFNTFAQNNVFFNFANTFQHLGDEIAISTGTGKGVATANTRNLKFVDKDFDGQGEVTFRSNNDVRISAGQAITLQANNFRRDTISFFNNANTGSSGDISFSTSDNFFLTGGDVFISSVAQSTYTANSNIHIQSTNTGLLEDINVASGVGKTSGTTTMNSLTSSFTTNSHYAQFSAGIDLNLYSARAINILAIGEGESITTMANTDIIQTVAVNSKAYALSSFINIEAGGLLQIRSLKNNINVFGGRDVTVHSDASLSAKAQSTSVKALFGTAYNVNVIADQTNIFAAGDVTSVSTLNTVINSISTVINAGKDVNSFAGKDITMWSGQYDEFSAVRDVTATSTQQLTITGGDIGFWSGQKATFKTAVGNMFIRSNPKVIGYPNDYDITFEAKTGFIGIVEKYLYMHSHGIDPFTERGFDFSAAGSLHIYNNAGTNNANGRPAGWMYVQGDNGILLRSQNGRVVHSAAFRMDIHSENGAVQVNSEWCNKNSARNGIQIINNPAPSNSPTDHWSVADNARVEVYGNEGIIGSAGTTFDITAFRGINTRSNQIGGDITYSAARDISFIGFLDIAITAGRDSNQPPFANGDVSASGNIVSQVDRNRITIQSRQNIANPNEIAISLQSFSGQTGGVRGFEVMARGNHQVLMWAGQDANYLTTGANTYPGLAFKVDTIAGHIDFRARDGVFTAKSVAGNIDITAAANVYVDAGGQDGRVVISSAEDVQFLGKNSGTDIYISSQGSQEYTNTNGNYRAQAGNNVKIESDYYQGGVFATSAGPLSIYGGPPNIPSNGGVDVAGNAIDFWGTNAVNVFARNTLFAGDQQDPQVLFRSNDYLVSSFGVIEITTNLNFDSKSQYFNTIDYTATTITSDEGDVFFITTGLSNVPNRGDMTITTAKGNQALEASDFITVEGGYTTVQTTGKAGAIYYSVTGSSRKNTLEVRSENDILLSSSAELDLQANDDITFLSGDSSISHTGLLNIQAHDPTLQLTPTLSVGTSGILQLQAIAPGATGTVKFLVTSDREDMEWETNGDNSPIIFGQHSTPTGDISFASSEEMSILARELQIGDITVPAVFTISTHSKSNGDIDFESEGRQFLTALKGNMYTYGTGNEIQISTTEIDADIQVVSSGFMTWTAGEGIELDTSGTAAITFNGGAGVLLNTNTAKDDDIEIDAGKAITVTTRNGNQIVRSFAWSTIDSTGYMDVFVNNDLRFETNNQQNPPLVSNIDGYANNANVRFIAEDEALFNALGANADVEVSSASSISFTVVGNDTVTSELSISAEVGNVQVDAPSTAGEINIAVYRRALINQVTKQGYVRFLARGQGTTYGGNVYGVLLDTTHEAGDITLDAQASRVVLDGSHGVRLTSLEDNGLRGTIAFIADGFDAFNGQGILITTAGDTTSPLAITFDSADDFKVYALDDIDLIADTTFTGLPSGGAIFEGNAGLNNAVYVQSKNGITLNTNSATQSPSPPTEIIFDSGNGNLQARANTFSASSGNNIEVAASRTLYLGAERHDGKGGMRFTANNDIRLDARRGNVDITSHDLIFSDNTNVQTTKGFINIRADEFNVLGQLGIGGTPNSLTFGALEGPLNVEATLLQYSAGRDIALFAARDFVATSARTQVYSERTISLSASGGAQAGTGRIVLDAHNPPSIFSSSAPFVDFQPSYISALPNGPGLLIPVRLNSDFLQAPTYCEHERELAVVNAPNGFGWFLCVCERGAWNCSGCTSLACEPS